MTSGEWKTVAVVGAAHFYSHFFFTAIPLLFPLLYDFYSVSYAQLGFGFAVFSTVTLALQAPMGFIVDRFGAKWILIGGVALESAAMALLGLFQTYEAYLALMALAGAANSVYHPSDYSILTNSIRRECLGKAFSIHTFCGQAGSVVSPVVLALVSIGFAWSYVLIVCGMMGAVIAMLLPFVFRKVDLQASQQEPDVSPADAGGFRLIFSAPVILGWLFFFGFAMSSQGLYDFSVAAFTEIYDSPLYLAGLVIWVFLIAEAFGILAAGAMSHRWQRQQRVVINCFLIVAACMFVITFLPMPLLALIVPMSIAGFFYGFIAPSRDVIISSLAPKKDMGKVFGVVTTGFNAGGIVGAPLFGYLLDLGDPYSIFWGTGIVCVISVCTLITPSSRAVRHKGKSA